MPNALWARIWNRFLRWPFLCSMSFSWKTDNAIGYLVGAIFRFSSIVQCGMNSWTNSYYMCVWALYAFIWRLQLWKRNKTMKIEKIDKEGWGSEDSKRIHTEHIPCGRRLDIMNVEMGITFNFAPCSFHASNINRLLLLILLLLLFFSLMCMISAARLLPTRKFIFMSI